MYDVEDAIGTVLELGNGLIEATEPVKHHFRKAWLDQLVARYRERPGKPFVRLSDLPDQVIPTLSQEVRDTLRPYWEKLVDDYGSEWGSKRFRCILDIIHSGKASRWSSLRLWRKFSEQTGFRVDAIEPYTIAIRAANSGTSRVIMHPRLPFNLATAAGAKIFGYRGDTSYDTSAMNNSDEVVHEDYKRAILATVGRNPFTSSANKEITRTNVGVFVTILASIAGLDNTKRQKLACNPVPWWFFQTPEATRASCLRAAFETEGSPTRDGVKLSQGVGWGNVSEQGLPKWPAKIPFEALPTSSKILFLERPPPMLVSAALLLFQVGIKSYVFPNKVSLTKSGVSVYWFLEIYRTVSMRLFERKINFVSEPKRAKLAAYNGMHRPRSSPHFS
jgi:hypothetical protein